MDCIVCSSVHGISQGRILERDSGLPFLSPGYLPDPGIEPVSPTLQADFFFLPPSHSGKHVEDYCSKDQHLHKKWSTVPPGDQSEHNGDLICTFN